MSNPEKPCPFCGRFLLPTHDINKTEIIGWYHPLNANPNSLTKCPGSGTHYGVNAGGLELWDQRVGTLFMEVVDNHPVFNAEGRGRPVDTKMINDTVSYYQSKAV